MNDYGVLANLGVDSGQMAWIPTDRPEGPFAGGHVINVGKPGAYKVRIQFRSAGGWGSRVHKVTLFNDFNSYASADLLVGHVNTPTGKILVIDPCYFHNEDRPEDFETPEGNCYDLACAATLGTPYQSGEYPTRLGTAVVTSTGYGDGCYSLIREGGIWTMFFVEDNEA